MKSPGLLAPSSAAPVLALVLSLLAALPVQAAGKVEVNFVQAETFADAGRFTMDRERTLRALREYMESLGRDLPDGQLLKLEVLDIDLAGTLEPMRHGEIRVLRNRADWPHMKLRYALLAGQDGSAAPLKSGTVDLADLNYMQSLRGFSLIEGELGYEKRMVLQWFQQKLLSP